MRVTTAPLAALVLLSASTCLAAPAAAREANAAGTSPVARFIDHQTIAVARVDLSRVELGAVEAWLAEVARGQGGGAAADGAEIRKDFGAARAQAEKWLGEFRKAGGREVYVVMSLADLPDGPPLIVVPLAAGANADALEGLLSAGDPSAPPERRRVFQFDRVWNVLLAAPHRQSLERARSIKPADRPDLAKALEAAGDAPLVAAAAPSADSRRAMEELLPALPKELGGGPSTVLTRGVGWANLALRPPPQASLKLVVQSQDAEAARALGALVDQGVALLGKMAAAGNGQGVEPLVAAMKPRVEEDRLVLALDDAALRRAGSALFAGPMQRARNNAKWQVSANNMRQLLLVGTMWAGEHNNEWPDDLAKAAKHHQLPPKVMENPLKPGTGYTYLKPPAKVQNSSVTVVLHDPEPLGGMRTVGYMDGRVERVAEETFQQRLKTTKEQAETK